jgi:hypothetical protein
MNERGEKYVRHVNEEEKENESNSDPAFSLSPIPCEAVVATF